MNSDDLDELLNPYVGILKELLEQAPFPRICFFPTPYGDVLVNLATVVSVTPGNSEGIHFMRLSSGDTFTVLLTMDRIAESFSKP